VAKGPVQRVGAYRFDRPAEAETAYLNHLGSYGVSPASGDCASGRSGDATWSPTGRSGCFLDENGTANVRVVCDSTYVGVLGTDEAIADLYRWTWKPANRRRMASHLECAPPESDAERRLGGHESGRDPPVGLTTVQSQVRGSCVIGACTRSTRSRSRSCKVGGDS
jgi:hypothetical protein